MTTIPMMMKLLLYLPGDGQYDPAELACDLWPRAEHELGRRHPMRQYACRIRALLAHARRLGWLAPADGGPARLDPGHKRLLRRYLKLANQPGGRPATPLDGWMPESVARAVDCCERGVARPKRRYVKKNRPASTGPERSPESCQT